MGSDLSKFHKACQHGDVHAVRQCLSGHDSRCDVNTADEDGKSALFLTSRGGHLEVVDLLLASGAEVNQTDNKGVTPFSAAACKGHLKVVQRLAQANAKVNKTDHHRKSPLYYAAVNDHAKVVQLLLQLGCKVDIENDKGINPLDIVLKYGNAKTLKLLLPFAPEGINLQRPFDEACRQGYNDVVECLLSQWHGIFSGPMNWEQASKNGHALTLDVLMNQGRSQDELENRESRWTRALHIAAEHGHADTLERLLKHGADPNCQNTDGDTPLHIACKNDHWLCAEKLTGSGASSDKLNNRGFSPYGVASLYRRTNIVEHLINRNADVNIKNQYGASILCFACSLTLDDEDTEHFLVPFIQKLITDKSDVNLTDDAGRTPLRNASEVGHSQIILILLANEADPELKDNSGASPLFAACEHGKYEVAKHLLRMGVNVDSTDDQGCSPLWIASVEGYEEIIKVLLTHKAEVNKQNVALQTPLYVATLNGHFDIVKTLLENGADPNLADDVDTTPLFIVSQKNDLDILQLLLTFHADPNRSDKWQNSPLAVASSEDNEECVSVLLASKADPNRTDALDRSPLYRATEKGNDDIVDLLLDNGASANITSQEGLVPLHLAAINGLYHIAARLLTHGADTGVTDSSGFTPLFYACLHADTQLLELVLSKGGDKHIDVKNYEGATALHFACSINNTKAAYFLIEKKSDINCKDGEGDAPLIISSKNNNGDLTTLLVNAGCQLECTDGSGQTAAHKVCSHNNTENLELLIERGANLNARDKDGNQPIHIACVYGNIECVDVLHQYKFDIDTLNGLGETPLHVAIHANHPELIRKLLDSGASINNTNNRFDTPLHIVVQRSRKLVIRSYSLAGSKLNVPQLNVIQEKAIEILKLFLSKGADINAGSMLGKTCLHWAAEDVTSAPMMDELISQGAVVDANNTFKQSPFHVAAMRGNLAAIDILLARNASATATDAAGMLPLHHATKHPDTFVRILQEMSTRKHVALTENEVTKMRRLLHWYGHTEAVKELMGASEWTTSRFLDGPVQLSDEDCEDIYHVPRVEEWAQREQKDKCALLSQNKQLLDKFCARCNEEGGSDEWANITSTINNFVQDLTQLICESQPGLSSVPLMSGSAQEGTKVLEPSKICFICLLHGIDEKMIKLNEDEDNPSSITLQLNNTEQDFLNLVEHIEEEDQAILSSSKLTQAFKKAACSVLLKSDIWRKYPELQHESSFDLLSGKETADQLELIYHGNDYPALTISVQLLPGVLLSPDNLPTCCKPLALLQETGVIAVAPPAGDNQRLRHRFSLRFTLSETELFHALSPEMKDGFKLAKIMQHTSLCPRVAAIEVDAYISTYLLKTCLFYLHTEQTTPAAAKPLPAGGLVPAVRDDHVEGATYWAMRLYDKLHAAFQHQMLPSYFISNYNLLADSRYSKYQEHAVTYALLLKTLLTPRPGD